MKFKKILFPFFKTERHHFLREKWWFRLMIVIYIAAFVITPFAIWLNHVNQSSGWCYDSLSLYFNDTKTFNEQLKVCSQLAREAWITGIPLAFFGTLIVHYLIQFIFFKIIVNFIVLGGKNREISHDRER